MKLRFTRRAICDSRAIIDYLQEESPYGSAKVGAAIDAATAKIASFPKMGRRQSQGGVGKVVVRPYVFAIYYVVNGAERGCRPDD